MYVRYTVTPFGAIDPQKAFRIADALDPLVRQQPGCQSVTWVYDQAAGEYGAISLWDTKEHAEAVNAAPGARLQEIWQQEGVAPQGAFAPRTFTVYEPRR